MANGSADRDWIKWVFGLAVTVLSGATWHTIARIEAHDLRLNAIEVDAKGVSTKLDLLDDSLRVFIPKQERAVSDIMKQLTDIRIAVGVKDTTP